jgi:hypothetical protein
MDSISSSETYPWFIVWLLWTPIICHRAQKESHICNILQENLEEHPQCELYGPLQSGVKQSCYTINEIEILHLFKHKCGFDPMVQNPHNAERWLLLVRLQHVLEKLIFFRSMELG